MTAPLVTRKEVTDYMEDARAYHQSLQYQTCSTLIAAVELLKRANDHLEYPGLQDDIAAFLKAFDEKEEK